MGKRAAVFYFMCVFLAVIAIAFLGLHSAGVSLTSLFSNKAATPATTPTPAYTTPKGVPLFADAFADDAYGWNLQSFPGNYAVNLSNGALTMEVDKNQLLWELLPGARSYKDFTLSVNAVLAKGDPNNAYGVYIRGTSDAKTDLATYYRFELYGDGSYAIFKGSVDQNGKYISTKLVDYTLSSFIQKQGNSNQIMIIAKGSSLSLIVNGQLVRTIIDNSYMGGSVALFVSNLPQTKPGARVQFSQLGIYPA